MMSQETDRPNSVGKGEPATCTPANRTRKRITIQGVVQGVGFRPFVCRLAREMDLCGSVSNSSAGVVVELEGVDSVMEQFQRRLMKESPQNSQIEHVVVQELESKGTTGFSIQESAESEGETTALLPDLGPCPACLEEMRDPGNRRFRYPFLTCTDCGPRFSIVESLPFDRCRTSMRKFSMCPECEREYRDPGDRRFHAQTNACSKCGPQLVLFDSNGSISDKGESALLAAEKALQDGKVVAVKSVGGFQLLADARDEEAVRRLRIRKHREAKPFAVMVSDLSCARSIARMTSCEESLLSSVETPIVLVEARENNGIAASIAPGNPRLGLFLPPSPLHALLLDDLDIPLIATSGNRSGEPIAWEEEDALARLGEIADLFLSHDRPVLRPVDDSVVQEVCGEGQVLRRARGYAPLPKAHPDCSTGILGLGAHLKNAITVGVGSHIVVGQHIGDLETASARNAQQRSCHDLSHLLGIQPEVLVGDLHPDFSNSKSGSWGEADRVFVQHHFAHIASCMVEHGLDPPVLGMAWDGMGFGTDGALWGGESLLVKGSEFERSAHFRSFRLPGGEKAMREPRRCALGWAYEIMGDSIFEQGNWLGEGIFTGEECRVLRRMLAKEIQAPETTSVGRLCDAAASLVGLRQISSFEGQAAMDLEFAAAKGVEAHYPVRIAGSDPMIIDTEPLFRGIIEDIVAGSSPGVIAAKFLTTLVECAVAVAIRVGVKKVALSGGCFQNRILTERLVRRLREERFQPYWHRRVPPNDGGIALGQVSVAAWKRAERNNPSDAVAKKF